MSEELAGTLFFGAVVVAVLGALVLWVLWKAYGFRLVVWLVAAPVVLTVKLLVLAGWFVARRMTNSGRTQVGDIDRDELLERKAINPARTPRIQNLQHGYHYTPAGLVEGVHMATIAESGAGKGQTLINYQIQMQLEHSNENLLLLEVKPNLELSNIVYAHARANDRIWEYTMQAKDPHSSALAVIDPSKMRNLSRSVTFERDSKDPHWNSKSEELIPAITSTDNAATINDVRDIVVDKRRLEQLIERAPAVDNVSDNSKEWGYIRSTTTRHLQALADTRVRRVWAGTQDTPQPTYRGYSDGGRDIVIVRPDEASAEREARFVVGALDIVMDDAIAAGHAGGPGTKAILDEFASFMDLSKMRRKLDLGRGGGLQVSYVLQGRDQLAAAVGKQEADSIIASTEIKVIGATSDYELAELVSKLSGKERVEFRRATQLKDFAGSKWDESRPVVQPGEIVSQTAGQWVILHHGQVQKTQVHKKHYHFTQAAEPRPHKLWGVVSPETYAVPSLLGPEPEPEDDRDDDLMDTPRTEGDDDWIV